jgi:hypothetical protein
MAIILETRLGRKVLTTTRPAPQPTGVVAMRNPEKDTIQLVL